MAGLQIFGRQKCFDTKKAMRFFKERGVQFQLVDLKEKGLSRGELQKIVAAVGDINLIANHKAKDYVLFSYLTADGKFEKLLENSDLINTPIVRKGNLVSIDIDNLMEFL
jgi:arsenate reductase-like glutaredoxin family protein